MMTVYSHSYANKGLSSLCKHVPQKGPYSTRDSIGKKLICQFTACLMNGSLLKGKVLYVINYSKPDKEFNVQNNQDIKQKKIVLQKNWKHLLCYAIKYQVSKTTGWAIKTIHFCPYRRFFQLSLLLVQLIYQLEQKYHMSSLLSLHTCLVGATQASVIPNSQLLKFTQNIDSDLNNFHQNLVLDRRTLS